MQHVMLQLRLPSLRRAAVVRNIPLGRNVSTEALERSMISPSQPTFLSEDGTRTLRTRKHGNKALPIPEIMDPIYLQVRNKYKQPKQVLPKHQSTIEQQPGTEELFDDEQILGDERPDRKTDALPEASLTPFQKSLYENPYARALGTSVRQCSLTKARLPSHFLVRFGLSRPAEQGDKPYYKLLAHRENADIGITANVQATRQAIQLLASGAGGRKAGGKWAALASQKTKEEFAVMMKRAGSGGVNPGKEFEWDAQMEGVVLKRLKNDVTKALRYGQREGHVKIKADEGEMIRAVLRLRGSEEKRDIGELFSMESDELENLRGEAISEEGIEYDLTKLFPPEELKQTLDRLNIDQDGMLVIRDPLKMSLLTKLDRLQNYVDN